MFSQINSAGLIYESPEVDVLFLGAEGLLCNSFVSGGNTNGSDDLEPGEDWGGLL